ncbi:MAG: HD-GYP domain-containing protein [Solirubrobacteraceae bacterium]
MSANLLLIVAAAALPSATLHFLFGEGAAPIDGTGHLLVMSVGSAVAALASVVLMIAGARRHDGRTLLAGGAFAAMTLLLVVHGLSTPGVILGPNGLVALAGGSALPVGGALLALTAVPALRRPQHLAPVAWALGVLLVVIAVLGTLGLLMPERIPALPQAGDTIAWVLVFVGAAFFLTVAIRAVNTWTLTRRGSDLLVVVGVVWLGLALIPSLLLMPGTWAWWLGHALEFLGVGLVGLPLALDVLRARPSHPTSGGLPAAALVADEEAFLGAQIRALMTRLETKDVSTEQHTRRVAELSVAIGERLGLSPGRLRDLAVAGLLHDIGKLSVPDEILKKPGSLTDEEMAVIRRHPVWGDELIAELGYSAAVRRPVRGHHERLDGSGYPDGLTRFDLETRILAVADVYDALVSPRVYRKAWDRDAALALLRDGIGSQFDPACVDALEALIGSTVAHDAHRPLAVGSAAGEDQAARR